MILFLIYLSLYLRNIQILYKVLIHYIFKISFNFLCIILHLHTNTFNYSIHHLGILTNWFDLILFHVTRAISSILFFIKYWINLTRIIYTCNESFVSQVYYCSVLFIFTVTQHTLKLKPSKLLSKRLRLILKNQLSKPRNSCFTYNFWKLVFNRFI